MFVSTPLLFIAFTGSDRAFRRYWVNQRVAGIFVEAGAEPRGPCRHKPVPPAPSHASPARDPLAYVARLLDTERASSDKENDSGPNSRGSSPKKPLASLNGLNHKLNGIDNTPHLRELLVCTGDISTCLAHGKGDRPNWVVYHTEEQLEGLIQALNKRGLREAELRQALEVDKLSLRDYIAKCPLHLLEPSAAPPPPVHQTRHKKVQVSLHVPADCSLSEALELSLRDHILELEEKIFHGCLGVLKVKDREAWRGTLMLRGYDKQADYLTWGPAHKYRDDCHLPNGELRLPHGLDTSETPIAENKYRDPGYYLEPVRVNGTTVPGPDADKGAVPSVVRGLASALLQVEQAIHHKYIKRPLGKYS
ncbi:hypothetical protein evm_011225 [Chilo suppressalis]|nr:hypothetical protein evm_011225 [Chilo suppressalis]